MGSKRLKQFLNSSARILVAVKETGEIHGILKLLLSKFAQRKDHITFLHVFQSSEDLQRYQAGLSFDRAICQALLDIHLRTPKVTVSSVVVQSSDICNGIVQEARKIKATLVVLGNSQRQFISRTMSKIGKTCVRNLPSYCSVMVVRKGKVMQVKSGCANCKDHTLKSLLQKENKLEKEESQNSRRSSGASSSSCSMETVLSFSADISSDLSWSSESGSPTTVLKDRTLSRNPKSENVSVKEFSYEELLQATGHFAMENLVGSGGCSHVYKATLQHGTIVAVKHLLNSNSGQREFSREIKFISYIRHQNLVSLIGFCSEGTHRLLVYKFLQNGSLQDHLYGKRKVLSWKKRQKVALGAGRGLHHLHNLAPHHIIHQDVKSSNILLSHDFDAQISDFGFARWSNEATSGLVGTFGYMAPEYMVHGYGNEKTDVHAFGVVLLELISGRAPIDFTLTSKEQSLAHFLEKTGATHELVDPNLTILNAHEMRRMMYTAFLCVRRAPDERPNMERVVNLLDAKMDCREPLLSRYQNSTSY
ncbi:serine/threonine-protein kinase BIK1 isoform X2 [Selaginella moellendorffii]|uniref:serine/threonine-protein kinase BIK1 isoform X2 n=1 Tax=Selaginella moellendorffii TaxID=88036 RepID=UPI000D1CFD72|nr:serine/threonine-protein kinase BIK1 isoform X2 [Selaginella moellendorffii]|eukprot:XP_024525557.1 serine/threonine-protein kinase BIK1 isoform X2 [Selaginella moellendorffii]